MTDRHHANLCGPRLPFPSRPPYFVGIPITPFPFPGLPSRPNPLPFPVLAPRSIVLAAALLAAPGLRAQSADSSRPNILFVVVDDLSDYVGYLSGHPQSATPWLDGLAERGTAFTNAHANVPQCAPSRLSMLSGKLPEYTGVYSGGQYNDGDVRANFGGQPVWFLPEILKDSAGYFTTTVGKVFHGRAHNPPFIDIEYDSTGTDDCTRGGSWNDWMDYNRTEPVPDPSVTGAINGYEWGPLDNADETGMGDYKVVNQALGFLDAYADDPAQFCDRPFFLGVGIYRPHSPFYAPERYFSEFYQPDPYLSPYVRPYNEPANAWPPNGILLPEKVDSAQSDYLNLPFMGRVNANGYLNNPDEAFAGYPGTLSPLPTVEAGLDSAGTAAILAEAHRANSMMGYLASVRFADRMIGRLVQKLDSRPEIRDNTIIVVVSDHGYAMGEKRHWGKVGLWDQITRVPMVIVDPRRTGNHVTDATASLVDLFPTLLELAGAEAPRYGDGSDYLDGHSLVPYLEQPEAQAQRPAVAAIGLSGKYLDGKCFPQYAVHTGRWHYIRYLTNGAVDSASACDLPNARIQEELYEIGTNREVDPDEFRNLAERPEYRGVMDYLAQFLPPDGPLYTRDMPSARIEWDAMPCVANLLDGTTLRARYTTPDGSSFTISPPDVRYEWHSPAFTAPLQGPEITVDLSVIDTALLAGLERLPVELRAVDTVRGAMVVDLRELLWDPGATPSALLDLSFSAPRTILARAQNAGTSPNSVLWDFGDGFQTSDPQPAPHAYANPGTYTIRYFQRFGNDPDALCVVQEEATVGIANSDFLGTACQTPTGTVFADVSAIGARANWTPVWQAVSYDYRYRPLEDPGLAWTSDTRSSTQANLNKLLPGTGYEVQVRAACSGLATDTSAWSYPAVFRTRPCRLPADLRADSVGTDRVTLAWTPTTDEMRRHEVFVRPLAGGPFLRKDVIDAQEHTFTGLTPGTAYQFRLRGWCPDATGNPTIKGRFGDIGDFTTLPDTALRQAAETVAVAVRPNPASERVRLDAPAGATARVLDLQGRELWRGSGSAEIGLAGWAAGAYLVEWTLADGTRRQETLAVGE